MRTLISKVLEERLLVVVLALLLAAGGVQAFRQLNIEAYPDPSPPTIDVITQNPGFSPEEMERLITVPLETQLNGMPGLEHIRSVSLLGLSDIKCYFSHETDYDRARQDVLNRLASADLPQGVKPDLSPVSATGEVYRYQLVGPTYSLMSLRTVQDWVLERAFKQVPGVIDVVSFGGQVKEFHVDLDPFRLLAFNVSTAQVLAAIAASNANAGGSYLDTGQQSVSVRGVGFFEGVADIEDVVVANRGGTPIHVRQLGQVSIGAKIPMGRVGRDGARDIVQGTVLMRKGAQSLPTLAGIHRKVDELNAGLLPPGMKIVPYADRTALVGITTQTVSHTLVEGMLLVGFILLAFLGDLRASLVVACSIPLSLCFTFLVMVWRGESANLISMGAIDFGIIVDASVVMVENVVRLMGEVRGLSREEIVTRAAGEVVKPIVFSTLIVVVAFLPIFTMRGVEGKIFGPMASTYGFALLGALILALTVSPVLCSLLLSNHEHRPTLLLRLIQPLYGLLVRGATYFPTVTALAAVLALAGTVAVVPRIGGEFMPKLEEGNLWVRATMPNSISYTYASELTDRMRAIFRAFPQVGTVVSQLGRPEDGTDATSYFNVEFFVTLSPREGWEPGLTKEALIERMEAKLAEIPGVTYNFSQLIQDNVEEAMSGVKGENSVKLFGEDLSRLRSVGQQMLDVMKKVPGVSDAGLFEELGQPNLTVRIDRKRAARFGILPADVNGVVQAAIGGQAVTQVYESEKRFDVVVRFLPKYRRDVGAIAAIPVTTPDGGYVPLRQVADVRVETGASFVYREDNSRYQPVKFSVRGRDLESTIAELTTKLKAVPLPPGYRWEIAGEAEQLDAAIARLKVIVPLSLGIIFFLLYSSFRSMTDTLLLMSTVPLSLVGGVLSLLVTGTTFSISAAVGFISVFGVTILGGVILVSRIRQLRANGMALRAAVVQGALVQLRPVLMAALAASLGLIPAALATGIGSETQRPLARVVVGGMVTSAALVLFVLPALYLLVHRDKEEMR